MSIGGIPSNNRTESIIKTNAGAASQVTSNSSTSTSGPFRLRSNSSTNVSVGNGIASTNSSLGLDLSAGAVGGRASETFASPEFSLLLALEDPSLLED